MTHRNRFESLWLALACRYLMHGMQNLGAVVPITTFITDADHDRCCVRPCIFETGLAAQPTPADNGGGWLGIIWGCTPDVQVGVDDHGAFLWTKFVWRASC